MEGYSHREILRMVLDYMGGHTRLRGKEILGLADIDCAFLGSPFVTSFKVKPEYTKPVELRNGIPSNLS